MTQTVSLGDLWYELSKVMALIEKTFANDELEIELTSYIDNKQNIWFKEKILLKSLVIVTDQAIRYNIDSEDKKRAAGFSPKLYGLFTKGLAARFYI